VRLLLSGENFRRHRREGVSGFNAQAEEQGQVAEQRLLEVGWIAAPDEVGVRLGDGADSRVAVRRRLFVVNDEPVALCDSYYPRDVAEGTAIPEPDRIAGGVYGLIEDENGPIRRTLQRSIDDVECRMPSQSELEALQLGPGVPVLLKWRLRSARPPDSALVFPGPDGLWSKTTYDNWRKRAFDRARAAAGADDATPYALRHSFASLLLHEGRSVVYVARQLGHDARLTLTTYGHVIDELDDQPRVSAEEAIREARRGSCVPGVSVQRADGNGA
jgi:hypothetical protein